MLPPPKLRTLFSSYPLLSGLLDHIRDIGLRHGMVRHCLQAPGTRIPLSPRALQPACANTSSGVRREDSESSPSLWERASTTNPLLDPRCSPRRKNFVFLDQPFCWTPDSQHSMVCGQQNSSQRSHVSAMVPDPLVRTGHR